MRASSSDRAVLCPHSLVAPGSLVRRTASDEATGYGHLVHHWKEHGGLLPYSRDWSVGDVDLLERKLLAVGPLLDRDVLWPAPGLHEVTFALNFAEDPPRVMWYHNETTSATPDEWKASFGTEFLTGTLDYAGIRDGAPWVDDLKTGRWPVDPATSRQLRSYALALWASRGCPAEYRSYVSITQWPKYPLDGLPVRSWHVLDAMDLEDHLADLRYSIANPDEALPGEHCLFCDAREPFPASEWMQSVWYRALPYCAKGLAFAARNVV